MAIALIPDKKKSHAEILACNSNNFLSHKPCLYILKGECNAYN